MINVYFAISYSKRKDFDNEIHQLISKAQKRGVEILVFVDKYNFRKNQEEEMMQTAFEQIDHSDYLIAELTNKSIGVGIEVGYAFAQQKNIIYIRKKGSAYSTTTAGCSDYILEYKNPDELSEKVLNFIMENNNRI